MNQLFGLQHRRLENLRRGYPAKDSANRVKYKINSNLFLFPRCRLSSSKAQRYDYFPKYPRISVIPQILQNTINPFII